MSKPDIYMEKYYPLEGRRDFYKWVIIDEGNIATDIYGNEMYFESYDFKWAKVVFEARKATKRYDTTTSNNCKPRDTQADGVDT